MEHLGTSAEVHLVASRMPQCSQQLSEHQVDNSPASRPITNTVPLAYCRRANPGLISQDDSWERGQIVMDSESNNVLQGCFQMPIGQNFSWLEQDIKHESKLGKRIIIFLLRMVHLK